MAKSVIVTIAGAIIGTVIGMTIAGMSYQLGDASTVSYIGRGVITVLGFGLGLWPEQDSRMRSTVASMIGTSESAVGSAALSQAAGR